MASASVNFALESLFKVIAREINSVRAAELQVKLLSYKLIELQWHIQDSQSSHETIRLIRDAAHQAEDLINKYRVKVARYKRGSRKEKIQYSVKHFNMRRNTPKIIEHIRLKVGEILNINEQRESEVGGRGGGTTEGEASQAIINQDEDVKHFTNFTADIEKMEKLLKGKEKPCRVISILGMGGSGKTALATKLCQNIWVKENFKFVVLVTIEHRTSVEDILRRIISNIEEHMEGINESEPIMEQLQKKEREDNLSQPPQQLDYQNLKQKLLRHLQSKRYLVVIDNVCESSVWGKLIKAFPEDNNGSIIIITTQRKGVANISNSYVHFIAKLDDAHGSKLFCSVVFDSTTCPLQFEDPKNKVVKISHGLPIVIVELGKVLAEKEQNIYTWNEVLKNENSYPDEGRMQWRDKLALSYNQIEINKKFCFFYLGLFPADFDIPVRQLIQLWIAEEFITQNSNTTTVERTAEEYLEELIERCLVQPTSRRFDGGIKTCRIHNVLRDLCQYESKIEEFLEVIHDRADFSCYSKPRRLSLHCTAPSFIRFSSSNKSLNSGCDTSSTRSFLCFGKDENVPIKVDNLRWLCKSTGMLRVLKLGDDEVESIPKRIRKLHLLKYLQLKGAKLTKLPDSICELLNLVTLDLRGSSVNCLPTRIWELQDLRHLYISKPTKLPSPSDKSTILPSLRIFSWLDFDKDTINLITSGKLPLVRKLGLYTKLLENQIPLDDLEKIPQNLSHLERLKIHLASPEPPLSVASLIVVLKSLTKITLIECRVNLTLLKDLPKLQYLKVNGGTSTDNLECENRSFPKLSGFQMTQFPIVNWKIFEGAMPLLERLIIKECPNLQVQLEELRCLTVLKKLHVYRPCTRKLDTIVQQMKNDRDMVNRCDIQLFG